MEQGSKTSQQGHTLLEAAKEKTPMETKEIVVKGKKDKESGERGPSVKVKVHLYTESELAGLIKAGLRKEHSEGLNSMIERGAVRTIRGGEKAAKKEAIKEAVKLLREKSTEDIAKTLKS